MKLTIPCLLVLTMFGCYEKPDIEKERSAIINLLSQERKAHFEENVSAFMSEFSDSMISVNRGIVTRSSREITKKRIQDYFDRVEFVKWDDVAPPKISFSNDGRLAYAIVQKQVILSMKDSLLRPSLDTTDFAWVSIYRKTGNEWKIECNISTNK